MNFIAIAIIAAMGLGGLWMPPFDGLKSRIAGAATHGHDAARQAADVGEIPVRTGSEPFEASAGESLLAVDRASGEILYAHNPDQARPLASITKLVTALVITDGHASDEIVTVPRLPEYAPDAETIGLQTGERYPVGDLLAAAMVPSANDAADALAIIDAGSRERFVAKMNAKLAAWGITGAEFSNPSGLTDEGNYATASSLAQVARLALEQPDIKRLAATEDGQITSLAGRTLTYHTTNQLLYDNDFYGIKTGFTGAAGQCFVGLTRIGGREVITVVLGTDDRFGDTRRLRSWIERNWTWL